MKNLCILDYINEPCEDFDQTARILIWIFAGRTCPKVRFLSLRLYIYLLVDGGDCNENEETK